MTYTIQSTILFNMLAQKKFNAESDAQMRQAVYDSTGINFTSSIEIDSAVPIYKGRRLVAFTMRVYPAFHANFKVIK